MLSNFRLEEKERKTLKSIGGGKMTQGLKRLVKFYLAASKEVKKQIKGTK